MNAKLKPKPLQVPLRLATDSPEAPPELLTDLRMDTPTGERSLANIHPCPSLSRPLNPRHIVDLARSICAFGLIEPLAIDVEDTVVAGSHRLAALQILSTPPPERGALLAHLCPHGSAKELLALAGEPVQGLMPAPGVLDLTRIPCRILPWSQAQKPDEAWRVQVAENERRRDYKPSEVRALADRLREQGYRFAKGFKEGQQAALPVLSALIGVSTRHVRRLLAAEDGTVIDPKDQRTDVRKEASAIAGRLKKLKQRAAGELSDVEHRAIEKAVAALERLARG